MCYTFVIPVLAVLTFISVFSQVCGDCNEDLSYVYEMWNKTRFLLTDNIGGTSVEGKLNENVNAYVCELQRGLFYCPQNSVISVSFADYGRLNSVICADGAPYSQLSDTNCSRNNLDTIPDWPKAVLPIQYLGEQCNNKNICAPWPNYKVMGDPCVGTLKYMTVQFMCIQHTFQ